MADVLERAVAARYLGASLDVGQLDAMIGLYQDPYVASLQLLMERYADMMLTAADVSLAGDAAAKFTENLRHLEKAVRRLTQTCQTIDGLSTEAQTLVDSQATAERKVDQVTVGTMSVVGGRRS